MLRHSDAVITTLYAELQRVKTKSVTTDGWFFNFLSIAVVPFFAFFAYCLATPAYRIFAAALPYISIIGVLVVVVLASHYRYAAIHSSYLQGRLNQMFDAAVIRESEYEQAVYTSIDSPVLLSYTMGFGALAALNLIVMPVILSTTHAFAERHAKELGYAAPILRNYGVITMLFVIMAIACVVRSWRLLQQRTGELEERTNREQFELSAQADDRSLASGATAMASTHVNLGG
jgi:hypothetical protein